ncbi:MAG: C4-dicarboxylate ABC transporter substrate-binding protein [Nitrincola lacisaponensis]|uniref:TRAP-type C4-dicarboxylate transport system, periplasmic component n=1 Tax=Nitrincola lacisaponensis TaxID=267850 RepID=A0A063Y024_9GAMM|nr:C4-dicarboxylate ABC transporter substrate-binding protein [Nitrincola lacisaponensis]KDE39049.1 TRAP-type C4-dicarboxylate transport system, periplasmic component [Nitrincola lacisaponensis]
MSKKIIAVSLALLAIIANSAMADQIKWRMPAAVPEGSFFYENFMVRFSKNVELLTGGRLEIQPFGAGVVVPAFEIYSAVEDGIIEAGHSTPTFLINRDPVNAIFAGFPGGMAPETKVHWIYEGGGLEMLQDYRLKNMGLKSLVVGIGTTEVFAHSHSAIQEAENLKGLRYRTAGPWAEILGNYFDGAPTVVPPGEIFTLLQRRGVDAVEWATPGSNLSEGFHEIAEYLAVPGVHQPTFLWEVVVKEDTWNKLPNELKPLVEAAAKLTTMESLVHFGHSDILSMDQYANTNKVVELSPELIEQVRSAGRDWINTKISDNSTGSETAAILESYLEYQDRWARNSFYLLHD